MRRILGAVLASALLGPAVPSGAGAFAEFDVDRTDDSSASTNGCTPAPNDCTLRGAIDRANNTSGSSLSRFPPGSSAATRDSPRW